MKKETAKTTKKYKFVVDLTKVETAEDIKFEFIRAKATNGVAITEDDILFLVNIGAKIALEYIDTCITEIESKTVKIQDDKLYDELTKLLMKATQPKRPWYKRFWGWVKHPFKKK